MANKMDGTWFNSDNLDKHSGKWVAVSGNRLIAESKEPASVIRKAKECKDSRPTIMKVPKKNQISIL
tara:strand:+ start:644 stop:844 length:201 start_codon:yes stop_codon:yes gene_type:complete